MTLNIRCWERLPLMYTRIDGCVQVGGFAQNGQTLTQIRQSKKSSGFPAPGIANHDRTIMGSYQTCSGSEVCASNGHSSQKGVLRFILYSLPAYIIHSSFARFTHYSRHCHTKFAHYSHQFTPRSHYSIRAVGASPVAPIHTVFAQFTPVRMCECVIGTL